MIVDKIKYAGGRKTLRIVYNNVLPFDGFQCVNLFGVMFVRLKSDGTRPTLNDKWFYHEATHTEQMRELAFVPFYIIYFFEWLFWLVADTSSAYRRISFEREAYGHQGDPEYLSGRRHYAQWRKSE